MAGIITFSDLQSIRGDITELFKLNQTSFFHQLKVIGERLRFNWKSIKSKQKLAIQTFNDCFDELEIELNVEIDRRLKSINDIYKISTD